MEVNEIAYYVDLTPAPLSEGEGSRDMNFGASHPSPSERGWG
jgi:hypothetical protein